MLDTNIASDLIKGSRYDDQVINYATSRLTISSITEAELLYGVSKKPEAAKLRTAVNAFLRTIEICEFDSAAAHEYAQLRSNYESQGLGIGNLDALIAAHALSRGMTLVTRDTALLKLSPWLSVEEW